MSTTQTSLGGAYAVTGRFLVPLDEPRILRWFLEHLYVVHGWRQRLLRGLLRRTPRVLGKADREERRVLEHLRGDLGDLLAAAGLDGGEIRCVGVRDYAEGSRCRYVLFLFREGQPRPEAVLKLRPVQGQGESLAREAGVLRQLPQLLDEKLATTVPRLLGYREGASETPEALLQSALAGVSLYVDQRTGGDPARLAVRHLCAAGDWLASFQTATMQTGRDGPRVASHGDFWHRNLLLPPGGGDPGIRPAVVDWENGRLEAAPWPDLFHFPLWYALRSGGRRGGTAGDEERFVRGFLADTALSQAVRGYFEAWGRAAAGSFLADSVTDLRARFLEHLEDLARAHEETLWSRLRQRLARESRSVFSG